jgi:hypothetical protein
MAKAAKAKKKTGRPSKYTIKLAAEICRRLMGGESLRTICLDDHMPRRETVFNWLHAHQSFFNQYAQAREAQADTIFDECLDIADDGSNDWMEKQTRSGGVIDVVNHEHISRSKLRVDTRLAMAKRLAPKKYGDRTAMELTGKDGKPIEVEVASSVISRIWSENEARKAKEE